ncbi:MFS transporter [Streptomyces sp. NPDC015131]|uniref:MFS transporter n=1 Tax=Streptomyces sp. NPDC015131 TaxID=3364941 RepID=UPI0036FE6B59
MHTSEPHPPRPTAPTDPSGGPPPSPVRRWAATAVVCLGLFLLGLDLTVLNVAVPDLQRDLGPTMTQVQWTVDGYALLLGGTVLSAGALTERLGRRRAFVGGLLVCAAASAAGGATDDVRQVVAARCAMGAGAALLMPATLSLISGLFDEPALRRRAIALWTAVGGLGGMTGPLAGGWLVEHFSWRAAFWVNVPIALTAAALALLLVPASASGGGRGARGGPLDLTGAVLSAAGLLTLVWAVIEAPARGWTSGGILLAFALAVLLLAAFARQQARCPHPMLPTRLLRLPGVAAASVSVALMSFALFGALFVITLYLQGVWQHTPWEAGLRTLPLPAGLAAGAALSLPLMARHGPRLPVTAGLGVVVVAFTVLAGTDSSSGYARLLAVQVLAGIGAGLTAAAATETVMGAVPPHRAGVGSAVNDATRQVGSALGVAVQGSVLAALYTGHLRETLAGVAAPPAWVEAVSDNVLAARTAAASLDGPRGSALLAAAEDAFLDGLTGAAAVAAAVAALGTAVAWRGLPTTGRAAPAARPRRRAGVRLRTALVRAYMTAVMTRPTTVAALRVPLATGRYGTGAGAPLVLAVLGDSLGAGVGADGRDTTPGALIAREVARHTGAPVALRVHAHAGAVTGALRHQVARAGTGPGVAVVVVGGNDVMLPVRLSRCARRLGAVAAELRRRGWSVVVVTCPDYTVAAGTRRWIHGTAARRSRRLAALQRDAAQRAGARAVTLPVDRFRADPAGMFSEDGCHPSPAGYADQVRHALPAVLRAAAEAGAGPVPAPGAAAVEPGGGGVG